MAINSNQIRAARGLLNWSIHDLGSKVGVGGTAISAIETGRSKGSVDIFARIEAAFRGAGVELTQDGGVRPLQSRVHTHAGIQGFREFFDDIYDAIRSHENPDVCVANADELSFAKWLGDYEQTHMARVRALNLPKYKVLLRSDDRAMRSSSYSKYRWMQTNQFADVCIYIYADKTAFIDFSNNSVVVTVVDNPAITQAQRRIFDAAWETANKEMPE